MQIAARQSFIRRGYIPYVTDGLIAMWDGEWNAGKGKHDDSATIWKDLIGDRDMTVGSTFRWGANFIRNFGLSACATAVGKHIPNASLRTLEVVMRFDLNSANPAQSGANRSIQSWVSNSHTTATNAGKGLGYTPSVLFTANMSPTYYSTITVGTFSGLVSTLSLTMSGASAATGIWLNGNAGLSRTVLPMTTSSSQLFYIGSSAYPLMGRVYCVRVYDRELTGSEMEANRAVDAERFGAGTAAPWSLDDPEGYITSHLSINAGSFRNNANLVSVNLPNATAVGDRTFQGCTKLGSVSLPSVTSVGGYTFDGCTGLKSVSLPNVTSVGGSAFYGCTGLTGDLSFDSLTSFGGTAVFQNCTGVTSVSIPLITTLSSSVFYGCSGLVSVDAPLLSSCGTDCFRNCTSLERFNSQHTGMCIFRPEGCKVGNWSFLSDAKLSVFVNVSNSGVGGFGNNPWQNISMRCIKLLATDPPCYTATQLTLTTSITSTCRFYVPDEAVDTYKAHAAYASRASYIYPASEFNESDWWVD